MLHSGHSIGRAISIRGENEKYYLEFQHDHNIGNELLNELLNA